MLGALANLNPADLKLLLDELRQSAARIQCIEESLLALRRMLEYEHGIPVRELVAHDPRNAPLIAQIVTGRLDVQGALGKLPTRGHLSNVGDHPLDLIFEVRGRRVGPYRLLAGATLDISFALEAVTAQTVTTPSRLQVFAQ